MPTKILKEGRIRKIFEDKQLSPEAIAWLDEHVEEMLIHASKSISKNPKVNRISKEVMRFIIMPNSIVVEDGEKEDDRGKNRA